MTPQEWHERVGRHVKAKRTSLGESIRSAALGAGISEATWRQVESGKRSLTEGVVVPPSPGVETVTKMASALGWPRDFVDQLLAGVEPATFPAEVIEAQVQEGGPVVSSLVELLPYLNDRDKIIVERTIRRFFSDVTHPSDESDHVRELLERFYAPDIATSWIAEQMGPGFVRQIDQAVEELGDEVEPLIRRFLDGIGGIVEPLDTAGDVIAQGTRHLPLLPPDQFAVAADQDEPGPVKRGGKVHRPSGVEPEE